MEKLSFITTAIKIIAISLGLLVFLFTVLPLTGFNAWWIRIGDFPRIQIAVVGVVSILILILFFRPLNNYYLAAILVLFVCSAYQVYCVMPYTQLYPNQVKASETTDPKRKIKILISNVRVDNQDASQLLKLIAEVEPEVVLLAEPNDRWMKQIESLDEKFLYSVKEPQDNAYGMAMYSQLELIEPEVRFLVEDDIPSIHTKIKLKSGDVIKFFGLHPRPPIPTETLSTTERDAELVLVGKMVKDTETPTIIAGDLNDVAWSKTTGLFQKISGMLDPRIGRGLYSSFHADYPFMRFPLDHVFHSSHFRLVRIERLPSIGSDHFPMLVVLNIEENERLKAIEPEASKKEMKQANQMLEDAEEANDIKLPNTNTQ